ncbi:BgTH12-00375 [Blumeria graminis f. sp. triticale]|uniref:BgTH12-00375 n=1 Tax=Blumeria graminis f. sp. triticale TaxID=1689686 RepID=A0A9W4D6C1_BLUGR|nr:BgTH12-00375 [Blumeria graminis f. sp. triticale]
MLDSIYLRLRQC